ncbi:MAG: transglycosylase domain-containing protein [Bdellovibrionales bacterium]|nr:transglycosylase domain-containing protein [Bdellovibrionales bacterium]
MMNFSALMQLVKRHKMGLFWSALILSLVFAIYLMFLWRQLTESFFEKDQFVPTRVYSDVARIAPPQSRGSIQARLQALGYSQIQATDDQLSFSLHPVDYPAVLLPENFVVPEPTANIVLQFSGKSSNDALQSIQVDNKEVPEIFLEPELVATLSRGNREIRDLIKFEEVPSHVWRAIISVEDPRFLEHKGLDPRGIVRAILVNLRTASLSQGGSTITMQLVKNLMGRRSRNLFKKFNELFLTLLLEIRFEKEAILERYLNEVYLGQIGSLEIHGVAEGAKHFFGKRLEELNLGEIALMAGLIRGPAYYSPYRYRQRAIERQHWVLKRMHETGQIAEAEAQDAMKEPIRLAPPQSAANKAPYFTDFVKAEVARQLKEKLPEEKIAEAGFKIYTTLDVAMNTAAQRAVAKGIQNLEAALGTGAEGSADAKLEGALAAVDHSTGAIRALVGGKSYAASTFNRILNMKRQVGSTFKPVVYLSALLKGKDANGISYGPAYPVEDAPFTLNYDRGKQTWSPKNYEKEFQGWISMRRALAHSVNTIAARLGVQVGIGNVVDTARALGVQSDLPKVPSLSLGVSELSPVELLQVYATIANHGVRDELSVIRAITEIQSINEIQQEMVPSGPMPSSVPTNGYFRQVYRPKQVLPAGAVDVLIQMMQSVFTEGTARSAAKYGFERPAAGKTGTTSDHRDSWFAGFTPNLTAVVWVGADQGEAQPSEEPSQPKAPKKKFVLTGATSALPIWLDFMKEALANDPPQPFPESENLTSVRIDRKSGKKAESGCPDSQVVSEFYWKEFEPSASSCEAMEPPSQPVLEI